MSPRGPEPNKHDDRRNVGRLGNTQAIAYGKIEESPSNRPATSARHARAKAPTGPREARPDDRLRASSRRCRGHPRLSLAIAKTWMAGLSPRRRGLRPRRRDKPGDDDRETFATTSGIVKCDSPGGIPDISRTGAALRFFDPQPTSLMLAKPRFTARLTARLTAWLTGSPRADATA
jgi:hypothetical protein